MFFQKYKLSRLIRFSLEQLIPGFILAGSAAPLAVLAYLGTFSRYLADDYSTAGVLGSIGFWKSQVYWYQNWHGRFSFTFLISLVEMAGVAIVPWLPAVAIILWAGLLFFALRQLFAILGLQANNLWTLSVVNIILIGSIRSIQEYMQVIFWQTGILTYQISLILFMAILGIFLKRFYLSNKGPLAGWEYFLFSLAFFVCGGFSETWVVIQISILGLGLVAAFFWKKSPARAEMLKVLLLGFIISWLALIVVAKAPGNMNRDTIMAELSFRLLNRAFQRAFWDVPRFLGEWLRGGTMLVLFLILSGWCMGFVYPIAKRSRSSLVLGMGLLVGAYILLVASFIPQYAVMGIRPADRALFMSMFLFLLALVLFAVMAGSFAASFLPGKQNMFIRVFFLVCLMLMTFLVPLRVAGSLAEMVPSMKLYAQLWDERDQKLRYLSWTGEKDVFVKSLKRNPALHSVQSTFWIEGDLQEKPDHWINQVAARYYKLRSITQNN